MQASTKNKILRFFLYSICLLSLFLSFGILATANAYHLLITGNYKQSHKSAAFALPVARLTNKTWVSGLQTLIATGNTLLELERLQQDVNTGVPPNISGLVQNLRQAEINLEHASQNIKNSSLLSLIFSDKRERIEEITNTLKHMLPLAEYFIQDEKNLLVLLQNSDELRATGGFMGSYAVLRFDSGVLQEIVVEDIYDADGQVLEYFEPPKGVGEFLSGGNGWRLPDANWHPDFAQSSRDTLRFFALAGHGSIDGVIAINLPVVQSLLAITGPILLPDQDLVLSAENISQALRTDRESFFAGSTAKKNTMIQAITQLKLSIAALEGRGKMQVLEQLRQQTKKGNVLVYFPNPELEKHVAQLGISGSLGPSNIDAHSLYYYPVESNVGINKVNAFVMREYVMTTADTITELGITLHNTSSQDGYVNYQRLLFAPGQRVEEIVVNGEQILQFDREQVASSTGQHYDQIGFLVTTLPNNTTRVAISLSHDSGFTRVIFQKQPGTNDTTLTSITPDTATTHQLNQSFLEYVIE
ncbi:MAG: hypothetical protein COU67_01820 [Candidatus Pacebacteria bacterium CG10_big_fil_rev_8_21_14_0_10_44_54]|nr:MAG: hypothetical protein COU67_01820 [Candidatus Pacebacteria bacterium CG10_big_fil_rev_8_21_14_0_10_44_54]